MIRSITQRVQRALGNTQRSLSRAVGVLRGLKALDEDSLALFKKKMIEADMGGALTDQLIAHLRKNFAQGIENDAAVVNCLKTFLVNLFVPGQALFEDKTNVVMMLGVNGVGKTTTIGKLSAYYKKKGMLVGVAPGDTYRAAAFEQLQHWANATEAVMFNQPGVSDPAAVMYDALQCAQDKVDVLLADTAGRMHGAHNLMDQLNKMKRVMGKIDAHAPHHVWLVVDGSLGQNSIIQAQTFHEKVGLTGVVITKLDGSAKGGALFSIAQSLKVPVYFVGLGEQVEDLQPFDPEAFVSSVLDLAE